MDDSSTSAHYLTMGGTADKNERLLSSGSGSGSSAKQWLAVNRVKVLICTLVVIGVVGVLAGVGFYLSHRSSGDVVDTFSSSSSSTAAGADTSASFSSSSATGESSAGAVTSVPAWSSSSGSAAGSHPACSGLYEWACADWFNRTALPVNRTSYSRFSEIDVLNNAVLDDILRSGKTAYPLLDNFFASCMDLDRINRLGLQPLEPFLDRLHRVRSWWDFMRLMGEWRSTFGLSVIVAPTVSSRQTTVTLTLSQAPLLLTNRAQYGNVTAVRVLQSAIERMLTAAGDSADNATMHAQEIIDLEKNLNSIMPNTTQPQTQLSSIGDLLQYSNVHFDSWLMGAQIPLLQVPASDFRVTFPTAAFFRAFNNSWMTTDGPSSAWIQYARYKLLNAAAPYLSQNVFSAFTFEHFPIREAQPGAVASVKVAPEAETLSADDARYLVCRRLVNMADIGSDLLGHAFMDRQFNSSAYQVVENMVADIRQAWTQWLPSIDWLDAAGRVAFQQKMDNMKAYIGGPPLLASYANVTDSQPDTYFINVITLRRLHAVDLWDTILKPFDPLRLWNGSPASTVNAYYYPSYNTFYLYAGFFQAPLFFFDDYVANAPWTGEVIGHEAGHGFDANGIYYNQTGGSSRSWLSPAVFSAFSSRTACTMNSYSRLQWNGTYVNGNKTIGENMADIIGIRLAYLSYKAWLAKQTAPPAIPTSFVPAVDNLDQYFMAHWAQTECTLQTPAALRNQILNDVHAPGFARINGAAQLFSPMAAAFNCPVGTYMNPTPDQSCFIY